MPKDIKKSTKKVAEKEKSTTLVLEEGAKCIQTRETKKERRLVKMHEFLYL